MKRLTAIPAPLLEDNIDTDVIFPARFLLLLERDGLGKYAFFERRTAKAGFVLDSEPFKGTEILIAGHNFGTGSSREQAVWSLADLGIRCVIARSFGEIFYSNCFRNGVLPIVCDGPDMDRIETHAHAHAHEPIMVNLEAQVIRLPDGDDIPFEVSPHRKQALLAGLDEIGQIMKNDLADIKDYETKIAETDPWKLIARERHVKLRDEISESGDEPRADAG